MRNAQKRLTETTRGATSTRAGLLHSEVSKVGPGHRGRAGIPSALDNGRQELSNHPKAIPANARRGTAVKFPAAFLVAETNSPPPGPKA